MAFSVGTKQMFETSTKCYVSGSVPEELAKARASLGILEDRRLSRPGPADWKVCATHWPLKFGPDFAAHTRERAGGVLVMLGTIEHLKLESDKNQNLMASLGL